MMLSVFTSYGQRPAGQIPSNSNPRKIDLDAVNTNSATPQNISTLSAFLNGLNQKGALSDTDTDYVITSEHISSLSGVHHIYYRQAINGIEVIGTESSLHLQNGETVFRSNDRDLIKNITAQVKSSANSFNAQQAIQSIISSKSYGSIANLKQENRSASGYQVFTDYNIAAGEILAKQAYYKIGENDIRMIWEIIFPENESSSLWTYMMDAGSGAIIDQYDMTISCNTVSYTHLTLPTKA